MAKVIATQRGYFGGVIREEGDAFDVPDEIWSDPKRRPSWAESARFGGKGDHDGDGRVGGSKPKVKADAGAVVNIPDAWREMSAAERKALAKAISGENVPNAKEADAIISAEVEKRQPAGDGEGRQPFADAPEPQTIVDDARAELGGPAPDWFPPEHMAPKPVDD